MDNINFERTLRILTENTKRLSPVLINAEDSLYFRLKWNDANPVFRIKSPNQFVDGAAVAFPLSPVKGYLPPICMGGSGLKNEVDIWHWRANFKKGYAENLLSGGMGTITISPDKFLRQAAKWKNGYWYVEFSRPLNDRNGAMLARDKVYYTALGVWNGFDRERAMKKSVSYWFPIKIN
ncbi:MAG: ethylbenzene dehydrogenase-related protein [bacterium]